MSLTSHGGGPGLYLRKAIDMVKPHTVSIQVKPLWPPGTSKEEKVRFGALSLSLVSTNETWVSSSDFVGLPAGGRTFKVIITDELPPLHSHPSIPSGFNIKIITLGAGRPRVNPIPL